MCLKNRVDMHWSKGMALPGDKNKFQLKAVPNSVCALSVTDRSTKILSKSTGFNRESVFKSLKKFDTESAGLNHGRGTRCRNVTETVSSDDASAYLNFPETDSRFLDSEQAFQDFGAVIISNLAIQTRPCKEQRNTEKSMRNMPRTSNVRTYGTEPENIIQPKRSDIIKLLSKQREMSLGFELRNFFPETWIWDIVNIGDSGIAELDVIVPHTITEWESEAVCLSKESGLGVAEVKRITTYQPFFLDFAVPRSVKRKEIFYLSVSVFNYEDTNLPIKITYSPSEKFVLKEENHGSYCVKSKSKIVHKFVLEPVMLGEAVVTIMAEIDADFHGWCGNFTGNLRDTVSKKTFVKYEGFPAETVKSGFICGDDKNFETEVSWSIKIPADIVETSLRLDALVSGDILGPSLKNIDKLLMLPTGCGEQNMILLAPNILILEYLLLTKPNEAELIEKALKNLDLGYQKQLNYRRADGSYSAFGEKDERGSIWLTAFVVRYISQAQKFIHIDKRDLQASVDWILRHQLENGCFPVVGKIYHRDLKGKFSENDSSKALTAYIIISLIESGLVSESDPAMKNAVFCLKGIEQSSGSYGELLTTYALLMVGEVRLAQGLMFETLKAANRVYGLLWWESDQESSTESSVEMTAYGILCLLKLGGPHFAAAASDAVKWITQYRNRNGGFVSTQDTILALEAVSKLSASLPQMSDTDKLTISLETKNENFTLDVTKDNMFIQQRQSLPSYLTNVKFAATGRGCALVQTHARYNTRHGTHNNQLKIQLKIDSISDIDLYFVTKFDICVRLKSATETIKMAVMEVFMVSGFYPDRASLYSIPISRKGVRKWEEYEEKVVFYFEDLKQRKVCVQFLVNQEVCVEKTSPAMIKLYDYYNGQHATSVKYSLQPECHNTTDNWLNEVPEGKAESKRDTSRRPEVQSAVKPGFVDVEFDLETPEEVGPLPVYVPSPLKNTPDCPECPEKVPDVLPEIYCSAQRVLAVNTREVGLLEIIRDLTPRANSSAFFERTVSFGLKKECICPALAKADSLSLIIVTPLKAQSFNPRYLNLDGSAVVVPVESKDHLHRYVKQAITYCEKWRG
ncbi:UNVERIFIED_CONTAM: hypothetical protein PYX00_000462 [Menopon gallinae]|uniref:Uncharacterized protein n=1 Tax=Menopon gallinae TaxID=328185 RepID=A0AAW2I935_9NEOP